MLCRRLSQCQEHSSHWQVIFGRSVILLLAIASSYSRHQSPQNPWTKYLSSPRHVHVSKWGLLFDKVWVGLSMWVLHFLYRSFSTSISALPRCPGHYGLCASFAWSVGWLNCCWSSPAQLFMASNLGPLYALSTNRIRNTASNSSSTVVWVHCLVMALVLWHVYTAIAYQWLFLWFPYSSCEALCHNILN
jgi:hypothetical protein